MKLFAIATGLSLAATALMGQGEDLQTKTFSFQAASTMGGGFTVQPDGVRVRGGEPVTGSPMSAKEVNKTVQTLSDGTEIQNVNTTVFYRDSQGRTRTEPEKGQILIMDPVAGVRITLNASTKTAMRMRARAAGASRSPTVWATQLKLQAAAMREDAEKMMAEARASSKTKNQANTEDLGFQMQNGVMAQGTRSTITIPQGQIGNSRDIHVVNERWYSKDLQMIVKSINSDPRFGVTTFELTNISQNAPDPTLFQVPTGYTLNEGGTRPRSSAALQMAFVGGGAVDGRNRLFVEAEVDGQLAAVMRQVGEHGVADDDVAGPVVHHAAVYQEAPVLHEVLVGGAGEGLAAFGDAGIEGAQQFRRAGRLRRTGRGRAAGAHIEFPGVHDHGNPGRHGGDQVGQIAEGHGFFVRLPIGPVDGDALQHAAVLRGFEFQVSEKKIGKFQVVSPCKNRIRRHI